jgi:hypothetical protein
LTIGGSHFGPQILLEVIQHKIPFVEIPLNYHERIGFSSVTGDFWKAWKLGWRMIFLVLEYRLGLCIAQRTEWDRDSVTVSLARLDARLTSESAHTRYETASPAKR